jgi:ABC-type sugar transport system substrate-binding protein
MLDNSDTKMKIKENEMLRNKRWLPLVVATSVASAVALTGCSTGTGGDSDAGARPSICAIVLTTEIEYFATLLEQYKQAGEAAGVDVIALDSKSDPATQASQFDDCIARGVSAIIATPVDVATTKVSAEAAIAAGIPVVIQGQERADVPWSTANVGYDEADMGKIVGELCADCLLERYPDVDTYQVVSCTYPTLPSTVVRMTAAEEALTAKVKAAGKSIDFVATQPCGTRETGDAVVSAAFGASPELLGVIGVNDASSIGAATAFEAAGADPSKECIVGPNNDLEVRQYVKDGKIYATVDLNHKGLAETAVAIALAASKGETVKEMTYIPMTPVTAANIGDYPTK